MSVNSLVQENSNFVWQHSLGNSSVKTRVTDDRVCCNFSIPVSNASFKIRKVASISTRPTAVFPSLLHVTSNRSFCKKLQSLHGSNETPLLKKKRAYFRRVRKIAKNDYYFVMSVRPSVRMEQFGSHRTNFHDILYLSIFRKCRENSSFLKIWLE